MKMRKLFTTVAIAAGLVLAAPGVASADPRPDDCTGGCPLSDIRQTSGSAEVSGTCWAFWLPIPC